MMEVVRTWSFWLVPMALMAAGLFTLVRSIRTSDGGTARRWVLLAVTLNMAALLAIQLHTNIRGESAIREEVAKLSAPRPFPTNVMAHAAEETIARSGLNQIVREVDRLGPWMLAFISIVLGMSLGQLLALYRERGPSRVARGETGQ
jgi:hypothetical protein